MAIKQKIVNVFDKGIIDRIGDEAILPGSASDALNFLDLGDRIELVRGRVLLGDENVGAGKVYATEAAQSVDGTWRIYRRRTTVVELYDADTDTWGSVTGLTGLVDGEDMSMIPYRSPAGSFIVFSSPNTGLYRVNLSNPTVAVNLYNAAKNFKGYIAIEANRMWEWGDVGIAGDTVGNKEILRLSYIDNDWPYTQVNNEALDTGDGSITYSGTLNQTLIVGRSLVIEHSTEDFTDVAGTGVLTGSAGGTGSINYTTGAWSVTFNAAPGSGAITADYLYEDPDSEGIFDFSYTSPTRVAGEGAFFFQGSENDEIMDVKTYDGIQYVFHTQSIWKVNLSNDDTDATNLLFRGNTGIPSRKCAIVTGKGIFYIDTTDVENKEIKRLDYNQIGTQVEPLSVSDQLLLNSLVFDECAGVDYGDYLIWACKSSSDVSYNDTMLMYHKKWKLLNKADGLFQDFTIMDSALYGASSVSDNVYQVFTGYADVDQAYEGYWVSNDWKLDSELLKKQKRFVIEGDIEETQEIFIDLSYDGGDWIELGSVAGDSEYVDTTSFTEYGKVLYGGGTYGSGEPVVASRYMREFRVKSDKFYRVRVRFRTQDIGYVNVRQYIFRDIRESLARVPSKFR